MQAEACHEAGSDRCELTMVRLTSSLENWSPWIEAGYKKFDNLKELGK